MQMRCAVIAALGRLVSTQNMVLDAKVFSPRLVATTVQTLLQLPLQATPVIKQQPSCAASYVMTWSVTAEPDCRCLASKSGFWACPSWDS